MYDVRLMSCANDDVFYGGFEWKLGSSLAVSLTTQNMRVY